MCREELGAAKSPNGMATENFSSAARFRKDRCRLPPSVLSDASLGNLRRRLSTSVRMSVMRETCVCGSCSVLITTPIQELLLEGLHGVTLCVHDQLYSTA